MARNKIIIWAALLLALLALLLFAPRQAAAENHASQPTHLDLGIFPRRTPAESRRMFLPLVRYLERELDLPIRLHTPLDFQSFERDLQAGTYDLVHLNQYHYIRAHHELDYEAILMNEEFGTSSIGAVIWVRKGNGIETPTDLMGKRILFGGSEHAMVSYIMAVDLLDKHGLPQGAYSKVFGFHPVRILTSLFYRQGSAAGSGDVVLKLAERKGRIDTTKIIPLLTGPKHAHLPWAVKPNLSPSIRDQLLSAMLKLNDSGAGKRILEQTGLTGIRTASDKDYDPHRAIVQRVQKETY